jgi:hypothetical protein
MTVKKPKKKRKQREPFMDAIEQAVTLDLVDLLLHGVQLEPEQSKLAGALLLMYSQRTKRGINRVRNIIEAGEFLHHKKVLMAENKGMTALQAEGKIATEWRQEREALAQKVHRAKVFAEKALREEAAEYSWSTDEIHRAKVLVEKALREGRIGQPWPEDK